MWSYRPYRREILSIQFDPWPLVITWSDFCNFIMGFASPYVSTLQNLVAISLLEIEIFRFYFITWPYVTRWPEGHVLDGCVYLTMIHQFAKFHSHRFCQREYITLLICHVTTHHHFVRVSYESIGRFFQP